MYLKVDNVKIAYELRMGEDDDDEIIANMEMNPFDDKLSILKTKLDTFVIVEKNRFDPVEESLNISILGSTMKNSELVIFV
jgi:hypothetical protein